jgi:cellulose synthase/poly-beta-1,6-N-acetylglucosamine synthase-like glycosyltransferase
VLATHDRQVDLHGAILDLAAVLDGLVYDNFEIIVVEDQASSAWTSDILAGLLARCPKLPLRVLEQQHTNRADALAAGFEAARYDLIFVTAADGQFDVRELNHLLEAIEHGAELAIGYRARRRWSWHTLTRWFWGRQLHNLDCAFSLARRAVWQGVGPLSARLSTDARLQGFRVAHIRVSDRPAYTAARPTTTVSAGRSAA